MLSTVYEISNKNVLKVNIDDSLENAIEAMSNADLRTIVVENKVDKRYYILTTSDILDFKISNTKKEACLKDLDLQECKTIDKNLNLLTILNQIDFSDEYMLILENEDIIGIVSYTDIVNNIEPQLLMERQIISELIHRYRAVTTEENASTIQAVELMKEYDCDAIVIINPQMIPIGIFTTKDFLKIISEDCDLELPIKTYMTSPIDTFNDQSTIADAMNYIKEKKHKRIITINEYKQVSGIITQKELLRLIYNRWLEIMKEEGSKISKKNEQLEKATSKLREKISLDFLTKIYNRNKFEELLNEQIELFEQIADHNFSLVLVDIDHFKNVNDKYGHLVGDHVLQEVAKILSDCSRQDDIVARWGGEEFALILPNTNLENAFIAAEKLRINIEKYKFKNVSKITASFGIAHFHSSDKKLDFFKRADEALYRAKALGRNKVELEHL